MSNIYRRTCNAATATALAKIIAQFKSAYNVDVIVDYLTVEDIRIRHYSIKEFADWLASGHVYFLLSHPAQAIASICRWSFAAVGEELRNGLKDCVGFPPLEQLGCSVFLQGKFQYLNACSDICTPSFQIF